MTQENLSKIQIKRIKLGNECKLLVIQFNSVLKLV